MPSSSVTTMSDVRYSCEENKPLCSFRTEEKPQEEFCPRCGGKILTLTDEAGKTVFACERNQQRKCDFITWDVPTKEFCPSCGKTMFKRSGRGQAKVFCENEACEKFVPLEDRKYRPKPPKEGDPSKSEGRSAGSTKKARSAKAAKTAKAAGASKSAAKKPK